MVRMLDKLKGSPLWTNQGGGIATLMLLAFLVLAVPLTLSAVQTAGQLNLNSQAYDRRLTADYNTSSALEVALWELLNDPAFDDGLTPANPDKESTVTSNGEAVAVIVSKIFTSSPVEGLGLVISKAVTPDSASVDTLTTFTYTITIKNEGTAAQTLEEVKDWLPPGFTYLIASTGGDVTTINPTITAKAPWDNTRYILNHAASLPYSWDYAPGNDSITGAYTPSQGVWESVPEYWETAAYDTTGYIPVIPADGWKHHKQGIQTGHANNRWRWKVQLVSGAQVTDLFTSPDAVAPTTWGTEGEGINAVVGDIPIQTGDRLRLRLEVYSNLGSASLRLFEYRWGGNGDTYAPDTHIPNLAPCAGSVEELKWDLSSPVVIGPHEEKTLTFQATATLADGTYHNKALAKYEPWWDPTETIETRSSLAAEVTVGTGSPKCSSEAPIELGLSVSPQEAEVGVATEFTHTLTLTNTTPVTLWMCEVKEWLPATFTYVTGQTTGAIDRDPDAVDWKDDQGRYEAEWKAPQWPENNGDYMFSIAAGQTKSFSFKTLGTLVWGVSYLNEVKDLKYSFAPSCFKSNGIKGGTGSPDEGSISGFRFYDVEVVAADGTLLARVKFSWVNGTAHIVSLQTY